MSQDILIGLIDPDPEQPRRHFDEAKIAELAQSMAAKGLAVSILVRPTGDRFTIVHGERRWRAAKRLGWETIRAEVRDIDVGEARWLSLIENVQRQGLSPIEEARAFEARLGEGLTQAELGERIGKSQSYIAHKLRLLGLPDDIQATIASEQITEGHARQLLKVKDAERRRNLCQRAVTEGWSVAETQRAVDAAKEWAERITNRHCESVTSIVDVGRGLIQAKQYLSPEDFDLLIEDLPFGAQAEKLMAIARHPILGAMNDIGKVCPGAEVTPVGLELPDDVTEKEWRDVGEILLGLASTTGDY